MLGVEESAGAVARAADPLAAVAVVPHMACVPAPRPPHLLTESVLQPMGWRAMTSFRRACTPSSQAPVYDSPVLLHCMVPWPLRTPASQSPVYVLPELRGSVRRILARHRPELHRASAVAHIVDKIAAVRDAAAVLQDALRESGCDSMDAKGTLPWRLPCTQWPVYTTGDTALTNVPACPVSRARQPGGRPKPWRMPRRT